MILVITPLVEVASKLKMTMILAAHGVGLFVGSVVTFLPLALIANAAGLSFPVAVVATALGIICLASIANRVPQSSWQVPSGWMRNHRVVGSFGYGAALGTGVLTKAPYGSWLGLIVVDVWQRSATVALVLATAYAAGRFAPLAFAVLVSSRRDVAWVADRIARLAPVVRLTDVLLLAAAATLCAVTG